MLDNDEYNSWKLLEMRTKMIFLEMASLEEIFSDFRKVISLKNKELARKRRIEYDIKQLEFSSTKTVGFFKVKTKDEKLR